MASIYMHSYLTIGATAARDSSVGCFIPKRPTIYVQLPHTTKQGISGELLAFLLPMRKEAIPNFYVEMHAISVSAIQVTLSPERLGPCRSVFSHVGPYISVSTRCISNATRVYEAPTGVKFPGDTTVSIPTRGIDMDGRLTKAGTRR